MAIPLASTAEQYADLLARLLPPGPIWRVLAGAELEGLTLAIGDELARVHARLLALLDEADPRTATETIAAWERVLGLPDPALGQLATIEERRALVRARWTAHGGQSAAYYIGVAAALGVTVTIRHRLRPMAAGDGAGAECWAEAWRFGWIVSAPNGPIQAFRAGGLAGYRVNDARLRVLELLIRRFAPAHTYPVFAYSPA